MKLIAIMIAMLVLMVIVSKQVLGPDKVPLVKVPPIELPKEFQKGTQEAMQQAASAAANNPQATVQAIGAAATHLLQQGAEQTAEKLKAAEAAGK